MKTIARHQVAVNAEGKRFIQIFVKGVEVNSELEKTIRSAGAQRIYVGQFRFDAYTKEDALKIQSLLKENNINL